MDYRSRIYQSYMSNGFLDAHKNNKEQKLQSRYFKKNYLPYIPQDKTSEIVDLGCGMGQFVQFCLEYEYRNVAGIDTSKENIDYCKKIDRNGKYLKADIFEFLKDCEHKYDCIVFNDIIEHLTKQEIIMIMDMMMRSLKKGGCVLIKTPNMSNPWTNTGGRYIDFTHEIGFTEISIRQVLQATGFTDIKVIGTDVYVLNPFISFFAKVSSKIINFLLYIMSCLYGRTSLHIFEKDILAIAYKK